jgi:hypothetical protein
MVLDLPDANRLQLRHISYVRFPKRDVFVGTSAPRVELRVVQGKAVCWSQTRNSRDLFANSIKATSCEMVSSYFMLHQPECSHTVSTMWNPELYMINRAGRPSGSCCISPTAIQEKGRKRTKAGDGLVEVSILATQIYGYKREFVSLMHGPYSVL